MLMTASPRWLTLTLCDWLVIGLAFLLARKVGGIAYWLASLVIGNRQHALSIMAHDGAHKGSFDNDFLLNVLTFWPLGGDVVGYRCFHFAHHRYLNGEQDRELVHKRWASPAFDLPLRPLLQLGYLAMDLVGLGIVDLVRLAIIVKPQTVVGGLGTVLIQLVFWTTCIATGEYWILALWYFSLISSFWAIFRLRIWIEHIGTPDVHRLSLRWWQACLIAPHWTSYHWEHHRRPTVPCWDLPALRTEFTGGPPTLTWQELMASLMLPSK